MKPYFALLTIFLPSLLLSGLAIAKPLAGSKPNIIFVITDDQGMGDFSCFGNELVKTPHFDKFHEGAIRLTEYHVSPTCAPTRAALMSGRVAFKNGVTHTILQRERMALSTFTLPQALKTAGYNTGLFGKWHLGDEIEYRPQSRGFDEVLMHGAGGIGQTVHGDFPSNGSENTYFDSVLLHNDTVVKSEGFCTDVFFDAGISWIKKQHDAKKPYFAYISLNAPHGPLIAPESSKKRFYEMGCSENSAARFGMIENIDDNFGKLLSKLEKWQALENTLIIFTTDNGAVRIGKTIETPYYNAGLRGGKNSPYEGGSHVPFLAQWKGMLKEGVDINALTAHIDLYKTFTDLAGATLPAEMQTIEGRTLLPLLVNHEAEWPDRELFFNCGRWPEGQREKFKYLKCAVRTQQWRLVDNTALYDISQDPGENHDVAEKHADVVARLSAAYDKWWESNIPFMVNEGLPKIKADQHPFGILYKKQLAEKGIPAFKN